jgi:hypothetical protein
MCCQRTFTKVLALVSLLLSVVPAVALEPVSHIVVQPDAPISIENYDGTYFRDGYEKGIRHSAKYQNVSDQPIVAVGIRFISYNVWDEAMGSLSGIALRELVPEASETGSWAQSRPAAFTFLTGFAFVDKVRFDDGKIWRADTEAIFKEIAEKFEVSPFDEDVEDVQG